MERRQTHLRPVAHQCQDESRLQPGAGEVRRGMNQGRERESRRRRHGRARDPEEERTEEGQRDPNRAKQKVLPGRLQRPAASIEIDERRGGQRRRLDGHPENRQVLCRGHERERRQEPEQTRNEPMRRGLRIVRAVAQVRHGVEARQKEQEARDREKDQPGRVQLEHGAEEMGAHAGPQEPGPHHVEYRDRDEEREMEAQASLRPEDKPDHRRHEDQEEQRHADSLSPARRSVSMSSNSRLM